MDDPYRLLITHAEQWSAKARRPLDVDLLETALSLRDTHDRRPGTSWPEGSAAELMTVRWPGHGPLDPPDVEVLVATLETFWRFLRATGRMASGSADVKVLTREARRSAAAMRDRLADPAAYGASKSLLAFGREIGITVGGRRLDRGGQRPLRRRHRRPGTPSRSRSGSPDPPDLPGQAAKPPQR